MKILSNQCVDVLQNVVFVYDLFPDPARKTTTHTGESQRGRG